jgi:hypothetical protein
MISALRFQSRSDLAIPPAVTDPKPIEIDILRAANLVIEVHGPNAWIHAALWADHLREQMDKERAMAWQRIALAINTLLSQPPGGLIN